MDRTLQCRSCATLGPSSCQPTATEHDQESIDLPRPGQAGTDAPATSSRMTAGGIADPDAREPTDEALVERLKTGDRSAVGPLFDRYYDELFAFADRFLADSHAAADAVQETFLRLMRYGRSFAGRSTFRSWLFRVLRNVCLDLVEDRKRRREGNESMPPPEPTPAPSAPDPRLRHLMDALDALPATRREVLVLRRFHDLSYAEIAEACGISEGAARVRAHRALRQLQRELSPSAEITHER